MSSTAAQRRARKAMGACVGCGFFDPAEGSVRCTGCLAKCRERAARRRARERVGVNLECSACGGRQTESFHQDDLMSAVVARVRCLSCGTKTMRLARAA